MSDKTRKSKKVLSVLEIKEHLDSLDRTTAELNVPDPKPEKAEAILKGEKEVEDTKGND